MIILIPVFYDNQGFWDGGEGHTLMLALFQRVAASGLGRAVIVSNRKTILELGAECGLDTVFVERPDEAEAPFPVGTSVALGVLREAKISEDVLVMNFKNPMLGGKLMHQAVNEFHETEKDILASAVPLRDHPCQIRSCLRFAQRVVVHFEDSDHRPDWLPSDWAITKNFSHNWEHEGVQEDGIYRRQRTIYDVVHEAVDLKDTFEGPLWVKTSDVVARIAYPQGGASGASHVRPGGFPVYDVSCVRKPGGKVSLQVVRRVGKGRVNVKVYPYSMDEISVEDLQVQDMAENCSLISFSIPEGEWQGVLIQVYEAVENGRYDLTEVFRPSGAPWFVRGDGRTVNVGTGVVIQGRQEMPAVFDLDGSLFFFRKGSSMPVGSKLLEQLHPMVIEQCYSMHLGNRLDYLRFKAKKRAVASA